LGLRPRVDPLLLIAFGVLAQALPLWLLTAAGPASIVAAALLLPSLANGVVNPSLHALVTMRLPAALRTQGLAAILAVNVALARLGYLAAGVLLQDYGVAPCSWRCRSLRRWRWGRARSRRCASGGACSRRGRKGRAANACDLLQCSDA